MLCEKCGLPNYSTAYDAAEATKMAFRGLHQLLTIEGGTVIDAKEAIIVLLRLLCAPIEDFREDEEKADGEGGAQ